MILHANNDNYIGILKTEAGTLLLGNADARLGGTVTAAAGATFGGLGAANNVTLLDGSTLLVGLDHNAALGQSSTLAINGTLNVTGSVTFKFDLHGSGANDHLLINTLGATEFGAGGAIDLNGTGPGAYTLISLTGAGTFGTSATTAFHTTANGETLNTRISGIYSLANGDKDLVLTLNKSNYLRTWNNAGSIWDGATANWTEGDTLFLDGDRVVFGNSTSGPVTVASTGVTAADMIVDTAGTYTFTGGFIKTDVASVGAPGAGDDLQANPATGKLIKNGAGTLILDNGSGGANNFTAGISLNSGTLQGNTTTLGSALVTGSDNTTLVINQTTDGAYTGALAGAAALAKTGAATLTLTANDQLANAASTNLAAGTLDTASLAQTLKNLSGSGAIATGAAPSTLTLDATVTSTFAGLITGAANIEKTGAQTLVLTGNNTHAGTTTINAGTLQLGDGSSAGGSVTGPIVNNAALAINHGTFSSTLASAISGANTATFQKLGTGELRLTADSSAYNGSTTITAGSLLLDGANARLGGDITIAPAAMLGGDGAATGNVTIASGGALTAGLTHNDIGVTAPVTLTINGTLDLADNATLKFDLFKDGAGLTSADLLHVGDLTRAGTNIFDVSTVGTGTYTLITSDAALSPAILATGAFVTKNNGNALSSRSDDDYILSTDAKSLLLVLTTNNLALTWSGSNGHTWTTATDNWAGLDTQFVGADKVIFDATAQAGANDVAIDANGVTISNMLVDGALDYTFTGGLINTTTNATGLTGADAPAGKLTKNGSGKLTFSNTAAIFVGGIDILAGALEGNTDTLNVGPTGTIANNGALTFNQATAATYANAITGTGSLAKTGAGSLTLNNAANTYAGGLNVTGGSLTLLNSGTATRGTVNIGADSTLAINGGAAYTIAHALTGSGTLALDLDTPAAIFRLDPAAGNAYAGALLLGKSAYTLSGDALANAALGLRAGNTTTIATGTHTLRSLAIDGARLIFSATAPADKNAAGFIQVTDLDISHAGAVQISIPSDIPATLPAASRSLLEQDDIVDGIRLIAATGSVTGDASALLLYNQSNEQIDTELARTIAIHKSATDTTKVADAEYNYKLGVNTARDGLYLGYALSKLTIADAQTLELVAAAGATEAASTLSATIEGAGGLILNGAAGHNGTLTLGGANAYAGATQVTGGIVKAGANNAFGTTASLDIAPGATVDLNNKTQTIGALANSGALALGTGTLTIRTGGASTGTLTGAPGGALRLESGALAIATANPGLHSAAILGAGVTVTMPDARGLGDGGITFNPGSTLAITNGGTLANTLASTIANAGAIVKSGTGTLLVTSNNTAFKGRVEIEDGGLEFIGNASLGAAMLDLTRASNARIVYNAVASGTLGAGINGRGTLVLTNGSRMTMDRALDAFNLELRDSTIAIAHTLNADETFNTLRVGSLAGTGTIAMSVNFGRAKHDQLIIDNTAGSSAADHFSIAVTPVSNRRSAAETLIPLIVGAGPQARFELANGSVTPDGVNTFTLWQGGQNQNISDPGTWYLAASPQLTKVADAIINSTSMMGADWHYELESLAKRMGDIRRGIFAQGAPSGGNLWLTGHGYHINASPLNTGGYAFEQNVYGATVGADKIIRTGKSALLLGLFGGMTTIDRDFVNHGDGSSDVINAGAYLTWMHQGGLYADLTFKYDNYGNQFTSTGDGLDTVRGEYDTKSLGASLELGYLIQAGGGWWCEPSVQAAYAKFNGAGYTTDSDLDVTIDDSTAQQYRAMVRWGKTFGTNLNIYVKAALVKSASSGGEIVINEITPRRADYDGVRTEFGIGATYAIGQRSQVWLDYEYAKADNYTKPWSFNAGYRLLW